MSNPKTSDDFPVVIGKRIYHVVLDNCQECGYIDEASEQIIIRKTLSLAEKNITLLHEILHQIWPEYASEEVLDRIARQLYYTLSKSGLYCNPFPKKSKSK